MDVGVSSAPSHSVIRSLEADESLTSVPVQIEGVVRTGDGVCITYSVPKELACNNKIVDFNFDAHGHCCWHPVSEPSKLFLATEVVCVEEEETYFPFGHIKDDFGCVGGDNRLSNSKVKEIYGDTSCAKSISVTSFGHTYIVTAACFTYASDSFEDEKDYDYPEEKCLLDPDIFKARIVARDKELKFALNKRSSHEADVTYIKNVRTHNTIGKTTKLKAIWFRSMN